MGVFNGIEMLFFVLGALASLSGVGLLYLRREFGAGPRTLLLAGTGLFLMLFTLAWAVSSVLEGEHQAANMGLLFFGLPAVLLLGMAWKDISRMRKSEA